MPRNVGVPPDESLDGVSGSYKVRIKDKGGNVVTGYIGEGSSMDLESTWDTPFESLTLGGVPGLATAAAIIQSNDGVTSKDVSNTTKVWEGTEAMTFNLPLFFRAHTDAKKEVDDAIEMLMQFASPSFKEVNNDQSTIPSILTIDIGKRLMITQCVIQSVSAELDATRTIDGYMATNNVQLTVSRMFTTSSEHISMGQFGGNTVAPGGEMYEAAKGAAQSIKSTAEKAAVASMKAAGKISKNFGEFM